MVFVLVYRPTSVIHAWLFLCHPSHDCSSSCQVQPTHCPNLFRFVFLWRVAHDRIIYVPDLTPDTGSGAAGKDEGAQGVEGDSPDTGEREKTDQPRLQGE